MISLAGRDILHSWGKFVFTGLGLGLLIGVTLIMAGVYRGMVDDGQALQGRQVLPQRAFHAAGAEACGKCIEMFWKLGRRPAWVEP